MFVVGLWNYRYRAQYPPHMNTRISFADSAQPDELDEEFDTFPTSRSPDLVRVRYDRLRSVAGRIQTAVGDVATQGERVQALLSWRDPRATTIFIIFCLAAAIVLYVTPFQLFAVMAGFFVMRHPMFRHKLPPAPLNFFRRLPAKTDNPVRFSGAVNKDAKVENLLNMEKSDWDVELLEDLFADEDVSLIKSIPIADSPQRDRLI
nr:FT-interacting protein 1-like [Ipomoea batatas]